MNLVFPSQILGDYCALNGCFFERKLGRRNSGQDFGCQVAGLFAPFKKIIADGAGCSTANHIGLGRVDWHLILARGG